MPDYKETSLWPMVRQIQNSVRYGGLGAGIQNILRWDWS